MLEKQVADTILQTNFEVDVGGVTFRVAPPTPATIIRLSDYSTNLPEILTENYLQETLKHGRNSKVLLDMVALLVCGAIPPVRIYSISSIIQNIKYNRRFRKVRRLAMYKGTPRELLVLITKLLGRTEITDFFMLIVSLKSVNILKRTREASPTKTTAFGVQSEQQHSP